MGGSTGTSVGVVAGIGDGEGLGPGLAAAGVSPATCDVGRGLTTRAGLLVGR